MVGAHCQKRALVLVFSTTFALLILWRYLFKEKKLSRSASLYTWLSEGPISFIEKRSQLVKLVFVTSGSSEEFEDSKLVVNSIKRRFADHLLLYYDRGLTRNQVAKVKSWCGVKYKQFDLSRYSSKKIGHVVPSAYKLFYLAECLLKYRVCMWLDSSVVVNETQSFLLEVYSQLADSYVLLFEPTKYTVATGTNPTLIFNMPAAPKLFSKMYTTRIVAMALTEAVYTDFLLPLLTCILNYECIGRHTGSRRLIPCHPDRKYTGSGACHSFETSALNILAQKFEKSEGSIYCTLRFTDAKKIKNRNVTMKTCKRRK